MCVSTPELGQLAWADQKHEKKRLLFGVLKKNVGKKLAKLVKLNNNASLAYPLRQWA
jgi:hypothetical protein